MLSEAKHPRSFTEKTTAETLRCAQGDTPSAVSPSSGDFSELRGIMTRRDILALASSAPAWLRSISTAALAPDNPPRMGGTPSAFSLRIQASRAGGQPFDMIEHCHNLGLAGVQTNPPSMDPDAIKKFRARLEAYNMFLVCDPRLPHQKSDLDAFETEVKAYKEAGAVAFHAALTGRRYEDFDSFGPWKRMFESSQGFGRTGGAGPGEVPDAPGDRES